MLELNHQVSSSEEGLSVEKLLRNKMGFSSTGIRKLKKTSGLQVNGQKVFVKHRVKAGDVINIKLDTDTKLSTIEPQRIPLDIVYEDDHLLVVNKPPDMLVHPLKHEPLNTLANAIIYHYRQKHLNFNFRPISRLDRDTSGLVVVAKHAHASWQMSRQLSTGEFYREYLGVVHGLMVQRRGTIALPIAHLPGHKVKHGVDLSGRRAVTHYQVLGHATDTSLVKLWLETGRTHQIRVHLSHVGYPLLGDELYGGLKKVIARQALHCYQVRFIHPISGELLHICAPLPSDMLLLVAACNRNIML